MQKTTKNKKTRQANKCGFSLILAISFFMSVPAYVRGDDNEFALSKNPIIRKVEDDTLAKLKKMKPDEQSDALLHLGKICFENHDIDRAIKYSKDALNIEQTLSRPSHQIDLLVNLAIIYAVQKKNAEAEASYESALEIARKGKMNDYTALITDSLGTLSLRNGKFDEANKYFQKAYELGQAENNSSAMINSLVNQATVLRYQKNTQGSLDLLKQALAIAEKGQQDSALGQAILNLARAQYDLNSLEEAVVSFKKAIDLFKEDLDNVSEANACWALAEALYDLQRIGEARTYYQEGLDALKEESDNELKIALLIGFGSAEADLGHSEEAQKVHTKAFEMATTSRNLPKQLEAILQMGNDLLLNGYPEAALYRLLDGEKLIEVGKLDVSHKGAFLMAIGRCYKTLGQNESAQKYYEEALKLYGDINDKQSSALALNSLAVLALDSQDSQNFDRYYKEAKAIYADSQDKRDLSILDYNYAQYTLTTGKVQDAMVLYEQALKSVKGTGDRVSESMILRGLGLAQYLAGSPQKAMPYYEQSLALADQSGSIEAQWDSHLGLGKCYKRLGLNDMAVTHLEKAVELVEKERGQLTRDSFKTFNLDLRNNCFVELVDLYIRLNRPYDALGTAEKGRARAFLDMLSSRKNNPSRSVETFAAPLSSHALPQKQDSPQLVAMAPAEPGSRGVSVIPRSSQIYSSSAISPANAAAPTIAEIKELVKTSDSTVVEYYILPDKLVCWVIDPDTTIHMLPPIPLTQQQLSEKVSLTYETITHQPKNQGEVAALSKRRQDMLREMSDLLIKPLESYLPKSEDSVVTIVPHGPMFMIPFAALIGEDKKFLVEKHTLAYVPAIGVMRATQRMAQTNSTLPDKLLAFGNPITKAIAFLGALPYSEKEVHDIADLFGASNSVVKIGQDADKKTFEEMSSQFSELHLATHGLVDEEHPMQSSLILAPTKSDDGLFTVKDILAMKELKAKLVVLSACQTGRGKITGDGVVGLSRAFIIAGTPAVLVSQWNVDDIITEYQMRSFYKNYLAHAGRSKALRQAQLDTIKFMEGADLGKGANGLRANPRYWSAFQLIGESR